MAGHAVYRFGQALRICHPAPALFYRACPDRYRLFACHPDYEAMANTSIRP